MFCKAIVRGLVVVLVCHAVVAQAVVTIDTVPVGNAGNANDTTGYGGVDYTYRMGKYEVTNSQYCEFLANKAVTDTYGLYNTSMSSEPRGGINRSGGSGSYTYAAKSGYENMPVNYVSWYDCLRFANWLENGQGNSDTESGSYTLQGGTPIPSNNATISRNSGARWVMPSENEWYKAAYHQPLAQDGDTDDYWLYPTATNSEPHSDNPASLAYPTNSANFRRDDGVANGYDDGFAVTGSTSYRSEQNYLTNVGAYRLSYSYYGTFDQGGNVSEWNEAIIASSSPSSSRGVRGGHWYDYSDHLAALSRNVYTPPTSEGFSIGFRVASVPEFLLGDANEDGTVDVADLTLLLNSYNKTGMLWTNGDFNYDGTVNVVDLTALLNNYNQSSGLSMGGTPIPEPSSVAMLAGIALTALLCWRRRNLSFC